MAGLKCNASAEQVSAVVTIALLALTGAGLFVWMWAEGWEDLVGVSVGVLFLVLALLQGLFTVAWQWAERRHKAVFAPHAEMVSPLEQEVAM